MSHKHRPLSDPVNHLWTSLCLWIDLMKWPNSSPAKVHHTQFSILPILPVYLPDIPRTDFWIQHVQPVLQMHFLLEMNWNALLVTSVPISNKLHFVKQIGLNPNISPRIRQKVDHARTKKRINKGSTSSWNPEKFPPKVNSAQILKTGISPRFYVKLFHI